jgi:hypothetical protein
VKGIIMASFKVLPQLSLGRNRENHDVSDLGTQHHIQELNGVPPEHKAGQPTAVLSAENFSLKWTDIHYVG